MKTCLTLPVIRYANLNSTETSLSRSLAKIQKFNKSLCWCVWKEKSTLMTLIVRVYIGDGTGTKVLYRIYMHQFLREVNSFGFSTCSNLNKSFNLTVFFFLFFQVLIPTISLSPSRHVHICKVVVRITKLK